MPGEDGDIHVLESRPSTRPKCSTVSRISSACRSTPSPSRCGGWAARSAARRVRRRIFAGVAAAARRQGAAAGEAAASDATTTCERPASAIRFLIRLRRRGRRRRAHSRARPHPGRRRRQRGRSHAGRADARAVPRRQLLLPSARRASAAAVQDQHGVEHGLSRLSAGRKACSRSRRSSTASPAGWDCDPLDVVRQRNFYGSERNDVTPYGMTVEDNIIDRDRRRARAHASTIAPRRDAIAAFNAAEPGASSAASR